MYSMGNDKKPNFVFILTDQQQRKGLGCYGNKIADTPNIDKLASHGLVTNGCRLDPKENTLPQALSSNGYRTTHIGKIHLSPHAQ
jgi:arylsulfatase A-like enzyme